MLSPILTMLIKTDKPPSERRGNAVYMICYANYFSSVILPIRGSSLACPCAALMMPIIISTRVKIPPTALKSPPIIRPAIGIIPNIPVTTPNANSNRNSTSS